MKKFSDYVTEQCTNALNENTSQIGLTDVFEGSSAMGPHHHEYWIFDETGYGRTSDAINEPSNLNAPTPITMVGGHIHFIKDGVDPLEAIEKATGQYGRFDDAAKKIDPRKE